MYRIGEFSYLVKATLKTLRYYDKIGLFSPKKVDSLTGYRYYGDNQIEEFQKIMLLKELNFSLSDIKELKKGATDDFINKKLLEANKDLTIAKQKAQFLQHTLNDIEDNMKYKIGFIPNSRDVAIGRYVNLKTRDEIDKEMIKLFNELKKLKLEIGITDSIKVYGKLIVNEEIGYKEEDIEMFLGYIISNRDLEIYRDYLPKLEKKGFSIYQNRCYEDLGIINCSNKEDISNIYSNIIKFAKNNDIKVFGPFREYYYKDTYTVAIEAYDQNRKYLFDDNKSLNKYKKQKKVFKNDPDVIGSWKIKEILPGIRFNPNKQKSIPNTKFQILELYDNGRTNYENITWTRDHLMIENDGLITYNLMGIMEKEEVTYLFIHMIDTLVISSNAKSCNYVYERIDN